MSTQKGNTSRTRSQKHQNSTSFKNNLYDTSSKTKLINSIQVVNVCGRCKNIIEWKIKYKKYKPLKAPKKCIKCDQKSVKHAYHTLCTKCAKEGGVCPKCGKKEEIVVGAMKKSDLTQDSDILQALRSLPERKRRTVLRNIEKAKDPKNAVEQGDISKEIILAKIKVLSLADDKGDDPWKEFDDSDSNVSVDSNE